MLGGGWWHGRLDGAASHAACLLPPAALLSGKATYASGERYTGEWRAGKKHGHGKWASAPKPVGLRASAQPGASSSSSSSSSAEATTSTPASVTDRGAPYDVEAAVEAARAMSRAGAALIDVGGQSTRPGSQRIPVEQELARVLKELEQCQQVCVCVCGCVERGGLGAKHLAPPSSSFPHAVLLLASRRFKLQSCSTPSWRRRPQHG